MKTILDPFRPVLALLHRSVNLLYRVERFTSSLTLHL
jgi:hypothetical protein